jgi:hypothetical protein
VWVGQVVVRRLEDEVGAPNGEEPADPSEDQPWEDVTVLPVRVRWVGVGERSLKGLEVTVRGRDQVGFVGGDDDGGGNRGSENDDDGEYRSGGFDPEPHDGFGERWPKEKEKEHGTEDCCGVYTSEDGESSNADDVVVEQRGTWLVSPDGLLKLEIPATRWGRLVSGASRSARRLQCDRGAVQEERTCRGYR